MRQPRTKLTSIVFIVVGTMAIVMGSVVLMVPALFGPGDAVRYLFALMFFLYGGYRLYSGITQLRRGEKNPII